MSARFQAWRGALGSTAWMLVTLATPAPAQTLITDDPYAAEPTGVVDDPCLAHPAPQGPDAQRIAKLHQMTRDFGQLCRYRQANLDLLATGRAVEVVFIGDSITDHWLQGDPSLFTGGRVGRGISGQTTAQMLVRFRQDVLGLRPRAVHIMAGTNDIAGNTGAVTLETIEGNIQSMAELARAHGLAVMIASVPPADRFQWSPEKQPASTIQALNLWLKTYAADKGFVYVDYYEAMADQEGAMKPQLARDGVHPTPLGYQVMRPILAAAIRQALP